MYDFWPFSNGNLVFYPNLKFETSKNLVLDLGGVQYVKFIVVFVVKNGLVLSYLDPPDENKKLVPPRTFVFLPCKILI